MALIKRIKIDFQDRWVCNYCPPNNFEGSFEIEAFSNKNTNTLCCCNVNDKNSISMVPPIQEYTLSMKLKIIELFH